MEEEQFNVYLHTSLHKSCLSYKCFTGLSVYCTARRISNTLRASTRLDWTICDLWLLLCFRYLEIEIQDSRSMCNWDRQLNANSEVSTFRRNNWKSVCQVWGQNANRQNTKWFVGVLSGPFLSFGILSGSIFWYFFQTISIWFGILSGSSIKHDLVCCPNHQITFIIITTTFVLILILHLILNLILI